MLNRWLCCFVPAGREGLPRRVHRKRSRQAVLPLPGRGGVSRHGYNRSSRLFPALFERSSGTNSCENSCCTCFFVFLSLLKFVAVGCGSVAVSSFRRSTLGQMMPPGSLPPSNAWGTVTIRGGRCARAIFVVSVCGRRYLDVVNRLDPVVVALEKEDRPVIVVSHQVKIW